MNQSYIHLLHNQHTIGEFKGDEDRVELVGNYPGSYDLPLSLPHKQRSHRYNEREPEEGPGRQPQEHLMSNTLILPLVLVILWSQG